VETGWHRHRCGGCGRSWQHGDSVARAGDEVFELAHRCPGCGRRVVQKCQEPLAPRGPARAEHRWYLLWARAEWLVALAEGALVGGALALLPAYQAGAPLPAVLVPALLGSLALLTIAVRPLVAGVRDGAAQRLALALAREAVDEVLAAARAAEEAGSAGERPSMS
jgi:hypothetical protein